MTENDSPFPASFDPPDIAGAMQDAADGQLRDRFALEAMRAILQKNEEWADDDEIARCCYDMADAMMAARSAGE